MRGAHPRRRVRGFGPALLGVRARPGGRRVSGYGRRRQPYPGYRMILSPCDEGRHGECGGASNSWYMDAEWRRRHRVPDSEIQKHVHACQCDCHGNEAVDLGVGGRQRGLEAWGLA